MEGRARNEEWQEIHCRAKSVAQDDILPVKGVSAETPASEKIHRLFMHMIYESGSMISRKKSCKVELHCKKVPH